MNEPKIGNRGAIGVKSNFPVWMQNLSCVTGEKENKTKYSSKWRTERKITKKQVYI
jgi:hypothetical protein